MNIKISVLKLFLAVVKAGNIQDAADAITRSPSAVSTALKLLEEEIGGDLFETDRKNHLTPLGKYFHSVALAQVEGFDKALHNVHAFAKGEVGRVQIATVPSVATYILPSVIKCFVERWQNVEIELRDTDSSTIARWVEEGKVDFGIGGRPNNNRVKFTPLFHDELVVVFPLNTALVNSQKPVDVDELRDFSFITNGIIANTTDVNLQSLHQKAHLKVFNTSSLLALVGAGVGVTILPQLTVPEGVADIGTRAVNLKDSRREIGIITNQTKSEQPAAILMRNFLEESLRAIHYPVSPMGLNWA